MDIYVIFICWVYWYLGDFDRCIYYWIKKCQLVYCCKVFFLFCLYSGYCKLIGLCVG